jgi:hypothetical protein
MVELSAATGREERGGAGHCQRVPNHGLLVEPRESCKRSRKRWLVLQEQPRNAVAALGLPRQIAGLGVVEPQGGLSRQAFDQPVVDEELTSGSQRHRLGGRQPGGNKAALQPEQAQASQLAKHAATLAERRHPLQCGSGTKAPQGGHTSTQRNGLPGGGVVRRGVGNERAWGPRGNHGIGKGRQDLAPHTELSEIKAIVDGLNPRSFLLCGCQSGSGIAASHNAERSPAPSLTGLCRRRSLKGDSSI